MARKILIIKLSGFAEIFTLSSPAPMFSVLANIAHYATSSLIWRNVWTYMMPSSAKNLSRLKMYIIKGGYSYFCHEYAIYFISWREKTYISFIASPLMKYAFFASLDEINSIFIPKIWISSIYCTVHLHGYLYSSEGGQWLSGRVLDSRPRGCGFEPHRHYCVVSLSKTH